jgi:DNA replication protein DnaC
MWHSTRAPGHPPRRRRSVHQTSRTLADLAGVHTDRTWPRRLAELVRPALLILDEFAMRELTAQQADDLYEPTSERAQAGRSLIATSNRSPADWYPVEHHPTAEPLWVLWRLHSVRRWSRGTTEQVCS